MGLDGISINQLRSVPENNSAELNNVSRTSNNNLKIVNSLSVGQKIDPDKENEHDKNSFEFNKNNDSDNDEHEETQNQVVIKYDLSKSDKFALQIDDKTGNILIVEKETQNIVQRIGSEELATFVGFLSNAQGAIINRKF